MSMITEQIGKIKSVACKDFITYDSIIFYPSPNLNIIIGANGTGKSSIVAAIILGMGGNCKLLSRSPNISDYIQNGKDIAKIEVNIYKGNDESTVVFTRSFNKKGEQCWEVDGAKVTQKEYLKRVQFFNIQVENLCQFLPQDKVQDFAKLNSKELLVSTQNSVCSSESCEMFQQLIDMRERQKDSEKNLTEKMVKLKELETKVEQMKTVIDNMETRKVLIDDIEYCKRKKLWMEFDYLKEQYNEVLTDLEEAKRTLKINIAKLKPLQTKHDLLMRNKSEFESIIQTEFQNTQTLSSELNNLENKTERLEETINEARDTLRGSVRSVQENLNEIKEYEKILIAYKQDLNNANDELCNEEDTENTFKKNSEECKKYRLLVDELLVKRSKINNKLELDFKADIVSVQKKIANFENIPAIRLRMLENRFNDTYKGVMWLRQNLHQFTHKIYETALLEVNLKDAKYAKYFENSVGIRDLTAFICEDLGDSSKLMNILREELKLNIINVAANSRTDIYKPNIPLADIRKYGFEAYLIDVIEGPAPVLNQLCNLFNIHNIPIGNDLTYDVSEEIPPQITQFFSTNHKFSVSISRYTGNKSTRIQEIAPKNLISVIDHAGLKAEKLKLVELLKKSDIVKNVRNQTENEIEKNTIIMNKYLEDNKKITTNRNNIRACKDRVKRQELKIFETKSRIINIDKEKANFKAIVNVIVNKLINLQSSKIENLEKYENSCLNHKINREKLSLFNEVNAGIQNEIHEAQKTVENTNHLIKNINDTLLIRKSEYKKKEKLARELCRNCTPTDIDFPFKVIFQKYPNTIQEIEDVMNDIQSRIECMGINEQIDIEDYNRKLNDLQELRSYVVNYNENKEEFEKRMSNIHDVWFPKINDIVTDINKYFSQFMCSMGFAGEVELIAPNREYSEYGIIIRVKYREQEQIQTLDRYVQSGGERAVAIAVYTLSLQHITNVPFRCVDEINQGMDRHNEKRVFEMIVKETCVRGKSQYFFVTPKLLPNLVWNDLMTVHIVHNGSTINC